MLSSQMTNKRRQNNPNLAIENVLRYAHCTWIDAVFSTIIRKQKKCLVFPYSVNHRFIDYIDAIRLNSLWVWNAVTRNENKNEHIQRVNDGFWLPPLLSWVIYNEMQSTFIIDSDSGRMDEWKCRIACNERIRNTIEHGNGHAIQFTYPNYDCKLNISIHNASNEHVRVKRKSTNLPYFLLS